MKKNVLIVCGGVSEEHEISLLSARSVLQALDRTRYQPFLIGISKKGEWQWQNPDSFFTGEPKADQIKLNPQGRLALVQPFPAAHKKGVVWVDGKSFEFDVAFPLLHGKFGEDGTVQGLFEMMGVSYVGSGVGGSWLCMDKAASKNICRAEGIPVADYIVFNDLEEIKARTKEIQALGFPCFVKPSRTGSSVGIQKVSSLEGLEPAARDAFRFDSRILVERAISAREIECAVLGSREFPRVAELGEIVPNPKVGWYSYEAKYLMNDGAELVVPATLTNAQKREAQAMAIRVFQLLDCYGLARVDLFLEKHSGKWLFNEVNTIPGFTPISMYPRMWLESGLTYPDLISELIELALKRA